MRPLSLTIQAPQPGERYDAQNEGAFRSEVVNQLAALPGTLDRRYLQLDGGVLPGNLTLARYDPAAGSIRARLDWGAFGQIDLVGYPASGAQYGGSAGMFVSSADALLMSGAGLNMRFVTNPSGSAYTERMRITAAGNVGIGTKSPATPLHVVGSTTLAGSVQTRDLSVVSPAAVPGSVTRRVRFFDAATTYTDVLRLGTVGSYRITIAGNDNSAGARSMGIYEVFATVSSDYMKLGAVTTHLEIVGDGLDISWAGVTGAYSAAGATLRMKTQQTTSNNWIVAVEEYGRDARSDITWLI